MQRGYMMGLRRALAKAQRETDDQADRFENVIAEIHAEMLDKAILGERNPTMWLN